MVHSIDRCVSIISFSEKHFLVHYDIFGLFVQ